jgi:rfaE bifunctional protein nucleotidyltransferase chain/domain
MLTSLDTLQSLRHQWRSQSKTVVFTNGCFDIVHAGHVAYLSEARKLGDVLVLGLNSDESVRRLKGASRPINTAADRAAVLAALRSVDYCVLFDDDTPQSLIAALLPDVLVKGGDYTPATIVGADLVQQHGGRVVVLTFVEGKSTTRIVEKIMQQNS